MWYDMPCVAYVLMCTHIYCNIYIYIYIYIYIAVYIYIVIHDIRWYDKLYVRYWFGMMMDLECYLRGVASLVVQNMIGSRWYARYAVYLFIYELVYIYIYIHMICVNGCVHIYIYIYSLYIQVYICVYVYTQFIFIRNVFFRARS